MGSLADQARELLERLGVPPRAFQDAGEEVRSPITGEAIGRVRPASAADACKAVERAHEAFLEWRKVPAPKRGELVRMLAAELCDAKDALGRLITLEAGKTISEGSGEVQEMVDICTYACGLSRQFAGLTIASERPHHRMMETWQPLGVVGVISAFNFPAAVWSWNAALALVCGDTLIWKPSPRTPLCALATQALLDRAIAKFGAAPANLSTVLLGGGTGDGTVDIEIAGALVDHPLVPLISATGSTAMGRAVAPRVARRFGRALLELGGNNAAIVCPTADLSLAVNSITFAAMGTAGQRCTTLRRLIVHESVYDSLLDRLKSVYRSAPVGDPRNEGILVGPLISGFAFGAMQGALSEARDAGGRVTGGERVLGEEMPDAFYVRPAIVEMPSQTEIVRRETFAPILYVMRYSHFDEALRLHNDVPQGLASSVFTRDLREAEIFLSAEGSDCGIANVNIGPSGAEIGGAFGGEKETGGGREAGSDSWKAYMRRSTNTVNYGDDLPLSQGVKFDVRGAVPERCRSRPG